MKKIELNTYQKIKPTTKKEKPHKKSRGNTCTTELETKLSGGVCGKRTYPRGYKIRITS